MGIKKKQNPQKRRLNVQPETRPNDFIIVRDSQGKEIYKGSEKRDNRKKTVENLSRKVDFESLKGGVQEHLNIIRKYIRDMYSEGGDVSHLPHAKLTEIQEGILGRQLTEEKLYEYFVFLEELREEEKIADGR